MRVLLALFLLLGSTATAQDFTERKASDSIEDFTIDWSCATTPGTKNCNNPPPSTPNYITASVWTVPTGITKVTDAKSPNDAAVRTVIRLSGGTPGASYTLRNRVTLADGQVLSVTLQITIKTS